MILGRMDGFDCRRSERDVLLWEEILELAFLVPFQIVVD